MARCKASRGSALFEGGGVMKVRDVMTRDAQLTRPDDTLQHAAQMMKDCDCGVLPVAGGAGREAMSREVKYCFEDEACSHVAQNMAELQVRRLPVLNRDKQLIGIVSLGDLAVKEPKTAKALHGISQPGGQHNQSRAAA